jgi:putative addiction module antidote
MQRTVFKSGNSIVISLPREVLEHLKVGPGDEVEIAVGEKEGEVVIVKAASLSGGVDEAFARQVSEFIEQYRPTLEALAR